MECRCTPDARAHACVVSWQTLDTLEVEPSAPNAQIGDDQRLLAVRHACEHESPLRSTSGPALSASAQCWIAVCGGWQDSSAGHSRDAWRTGDQGRDEVFLRPVSGIFIEGAPAILRPCRAGEPLSQIIRTGPSPLPYTISGDIGVGRFSNPARAEG